MIIVSAAYPTFQCHIIPTILFVFVTREREKEHEWKTKQEQAHKHTCFIIISFFSFLLLFFHRPSSMLFPFLHFSVNYFDRCILNSVHQVKVIETYIEFRLISYSMSENEKKNYWMFSSHSASLYLIERKHLLVRADSKRNTHSKGTSHHVFINIINWRCIWKKKTEQSNFSPIITDNNIAAIGINIDNDDAFSRPIFLMPVTCMLSIYDMIWVNGWKKVTVDHLFGSFGFLLAWSSQYHNA